jgi:hypothetical protein
MVTIHNDDIDIKNRLDVVIAILLNQTSLQESTTKEKITLLAAFDFDYKEISKILNVSPSLVAKEKSLFKKGRKNG